MSELEVLPACEDYGVGVIPWSPLSGGLLGGVLEKIEKGRRASEHMQKEIDEKHETLEKWESFCKEMGKPPAEVALAWVLNHPAVTAPIIGPRTLEQLTDALKATKIRFKKDELKQIDELWPGPGGEAPEAYAW
jgi:aryl-alcohol dehydrogenase-like predicted oxidoreductase